MSVEDDTGGKIDVLAVHPRVEGVLLEDVRAPQRVRAAEVAHARENLQQQMQIHSRHDRLAMGMLQACCISTPYACTTR